MRKFNRLERRLCIHQDARRSKNSDAGFYLPLRLRPKPIFLANCERAAA